MSGRSALSSLGLRTTLACAICCFVACGESPMEPSTVPDLEGVVSEVAGDRIHVDDPVAAPDCGWALSGLKAAVVGVRLADGQWRRVDASFVTVGAAVRVWAGSALIDTCPGQSSVSTIELQLR